MNFRFFFWQRGHYGTGNQTYTRFEFADGTVWEDIRQTPQFVTGSTMAVSAPASQATT